MPPPDDAAGSRRLRASYDRVAAEYAARIGDELAGKPLDRALLDDLADRTRDRGPVADLGCGPGHVTGYLRDRGADAFGLDLSPGMAAEARRRVPAAPAVAADLLALPLADGALAGAVAFYSLIHVPAGRLPAALAESARVLQPGGVLLVGFHVGDEVRHLDEWWGHPVSLDFRFLRVDDVRQAMVEAGLRVQEAVERDPYPEVEVGTRRGYLRAVRPAPVSGGPVSGGPVSGGPVSGGPVSPGRPGTSTASGPP